MGEYDFTCADRFIELYKDLVIEHGISDLATIFRGEPSNLKSEIYYKFVSQADEIFADMSTKYGGAMDKNFYLKNIQYFIHEMAKVFKYDFYCERFSEEEFNRKNRIDIYGNPLNVEKHIKEWSLAKIKELDLQGYSFQDALNMSDVADYIGSFIFNGHLKYDINAGFYSGDLGLESVSPLALDVVAKYSLHDSVEGIIDREGVFYPCKDSHDNLVAILVANGIDLKDCVRVNFDYSGNHVFSTFADAFIADEYLEDTKAIKLTEAQARTMYEFHSSIRQIMPRYAHESFADNIYRSCNFGWYLQEGSLMDIDHYDDEVARHNLDLFSKIIFDKYPADIIHQDQDIYKLYDIVMDSNRQVRSRLLSPMGDGE